MRKHFENTWGLNGMLLKIEFERPSERKSSRTVKLWKNIIPDFKSGNMRFSLLLCAEKLRRSIVRITFNFDPRAFRGDGDAAVSVKFSSRGI